MPCYCASYRQYFVMFAIAFALTLVIAGCIAWAEDWSGYSNGQIVEAIGKAENSVKFPYGILTKYKHTTPRQACFNTVRSARKRFAKQSKEGDFIVFLGQTYCPIGAKNDPTGLNKNWIKNVKYFLNKTRR